MKALISTTEVFAYSWVSSWVENPTTEEWDPVYSEILDCQRVAQVVNDDETFEVYETLIWVDCPNDCVQDEWYYKDNQFFVKPQNEPKP